MSGSLRRFVFSALLGVGDGWPSLQDCGMQRQPLLSDQHTARREAQRVARIPQLEVGFSHVLPRDSRDTANGWTRSKPL